MERSSKFCLFAAILLLNIGLSAQIVNCNPDPNGEPWIAGTLPEVTPEIQNEMEQISELVINRRYDITLPYKVDNSKKIWFRDIFNQDGGCCGQASGVAYLYTYEINRVRNVSANSVINQYPTHFTWNYLNHGDNGQGAWCYKGWEVIKHSGIPNVFDYGGLTMSGNYKYKVWMDGYSKYKNALDNKTIVEYNVISTGTLENLDVLKHWLNDHGCGEESGGLANFACYISGAQYAILPEDSDESGKLIVVRWGDGGYHSLTIVGYNDSIKYDFNGDGKYTNNGDDMSQWEIGALKVANSWGKTYCDSGFVYMPYRLLKNTKSDGGISPRKVYVLTVDDYYNSEFTLKVNIKHNCRKDLCLYAGCAPDASYNQPIKIEGYNAYNAYKPKQEDNAPCLSMQGVNDVPIELCLDFGQFYDLDSVGKVFLKLEEEDDNDQNYGEISNFTLYDYRWNEVFELQSPQSFAQINNDTSTILSINYDLLPFQSPIVSDMTLSTDHIVRRNVRVNDNTSLVIGNGVNVDLYGTDSYDCKLIVDESSNLSIGNNAIITAKRGNCEIIIKGDIIIGENVAFVAENDASLKVMILGQNDIFIDGGNFHNVSVEIDAMGGGGSLVCGENVFVTNCVFLANKDDVDYALKIRNYDDFAICNNVFIGGPSGEKYFNDGVIVQYCGGASYGNISQNRIEGCKYTGLTIYSSNTDVRLNQITNCGYGVKLLNSSTINKFSGKCEAMSASMTQSVYDNDYGGIYIYKGCMPETFVNNFITTSNNGWLVRYEDNDNMRGAYHKLNLEYNNWGNLSNTQINSKLEYITNTSNVVEFDYTPKWNLGACSANVGGDVAYNKSLKADSLWSIGQKESAKMIYKDIISMYPESVTAENSLKKLLMIEKNGDYECLQSYYMTDDVISNNGNLNLMADCLVNKCDESLKNYDKAIAWYESKILDESSSYNDSVFAVIDLGNLYLKINEDGVKRTCGRLGQFKPKSREDYSMKVDAALRTLKIEKKGNTSTQNISSNEDFWIQIELPDGVEKVGCMTENTETNQMILATEMGLFSSDDNCETMIYANELSEGCWDIKYNDGYIYAITSNGRFCYKAVGSDWSFCDVPDAESCRCIFCASNGDVFLGAWNGIFKSIDNGKTWTHVYKTSATCLSKCLLESDKVILAGVIDFFESGRILRSVDGGDTWESVVNAPSNAIVRNSKGELFAGHYFAGMYDDNLSFSKSVDNGMTWEEVSESYPDVGSMVIDGDDVIYSSDSYKKSIYRTTDGGKSYQCIYDDNKLNSEIKLYISESGYLYAYFDETLLRSKEPLKTPAVISVPKEYCGNELVVYPNPAQGHVKIETGDISFIEVYSIRGQLVDKIDVNADVADIDMSGYDGGVYVFKVHANGKIYFSRTVKLNSGN